MTAAFFASRGLSLALLALCAGLAVGLWAEIRTYGRMPPQLPATATAAKDLPPSLHVDARGGALPPIGQFRATVERPLFTASRRPSEEPPAASDDSALALPPDIELTGVVIGDGKRIANLKGAEDERVRVLSEGDVVDGWRIVTILPDRVVLRSGERTEDLLLKREEDAAPPAAKAKPDRRRRRPTRRLPADRPGGEADD